MIARNRAGRGRYAPDDHDDPPVEEPRGLRVRLERTAEGLTGSVTNDTNRSCEVCLEVGPGGAFCLDFVLGDPPAEVGGGLTSSAGGGTCATTAADPIVWQQIALNVYRSPDDRFEIEYGCASGLLTVRDQWTGESVTGLATKQAAEQWCRTRLEGRRLNWRGDAQGEVAFADGKHFEVIHDIGAGWIGIDHRFVGDGRPNLRNSQTFDTLGAAKRWCEVRNVCVVEGGPGDARTLRYDPDASTIPF